MKFLCFLILIISNTAKAGILDIKFTEIMYNPTSEGAFQSNELEFIEIKNTGSSAVVMDGVSIEGAIYYTFPLNTTLSAGEIYLIVSNPTGFSVRYPNVVPNAEYFGNLKNSGERLYMITGFDTILNFRYNDNVPWPILADGNGFSIVPVELNPVDNQENGEDWKPSANINGSPGENEPLGINFEYIYINECLTHTDLPDVDAVEIHNSSINEVDISFWYVSDDRSNLKSYQFPNGSIIEPGGYLVIDENDFNSSVDGFRLNRSGDNIYLVSGNADGEFTGFEQGWSFGAQYNGTSFGVHVTSEQEKHFVAQTTTTLGFANSYPRVGPLIITDINYHPDITSEEYLVVKNIADTVVNLWDSSIPDSTWSISGIRFKFPKNTNISPNEKVIICALDTLSFRIKYGIENSIKLFQYEGRMNNDGEKLAIYGLLRSDTAGINNDSIFMPKIIIDEVRYNDNLPWPLSADGYGDRLKKIEPYDYSNDPINWSAESSNFLNNQKHNKSEIKIFPTISNGEVNIELPKRILVNIKLIDSYGRIIFKRAISAKKITLERKNIPNGLYYIDMNFGNYSITKKIIFD